MEAFETYRGYLFGIAYRMLGSAMDAEDMVQETYLRYQAAQPAAIQSLKAYLSTILIRLCVDQLQLARRKREQYVGPWLPEPILTEMTASPASAGAEDPAERVDREESISLAFLVLLEQLQPFERAVFLMREVFEYPFVEIARMLNKNETACRRSFSRSKQHLHAHRPRFPASADTHQRLLNSYMQAVETGEISTLMNLLSEQVTLWTDAGGRIKQAALRPIHGRDAVARFSVGTQRFLPKNARIEIGIVNGQAAIIIRAGERMFSIVTIEVVDEHIQSVYVLANPEKLASLERGSAI